MPSCARLDELKTTDPQKENDFQCHVKGWWLSNYHILRNKRAGRSIAIVLSHAATEGAPINGSVRTFHDNK